MSWSDCRYGKWVQLEYAAEKQGDAWLDEKENEPAGSYR
jgi:hypothetical protein